MTIARKSSKKKADAPKIAPALSPERIIKKYPNRRLYDTASSSYITLAQVKALVMNGSAFKVHDAKTNADLTRSLLLQIILEEEAAGTPLLSETVLANIIRTYGHAMQGFMGSFLEKNLQAFSDMQHQYKDQPFKTIPLVNADWAQPINAMQNQMMALFGLKK